MNLEQNAEDKDLPRLALVAVLGGLTLTAFAANSLLCRMALGGKLIDPVSFTILRLTSGALALAPVSGLFRRPGASDRIAGSWGSGLALFAYAILFSLAYVSLSTGTGALILFGSVQVTMIGAAYRAGQTPKPAQWAGLFIAVAGLIYSASGDRVS